MAQYQSSFDDADYGCGEVSKVAAEFDLEPVSISHIANEPSLARVTFNFTNKLTLSNVKYSTTTDQDVSAWLVLSSAVEGLISSDKTFVPRQDCTTTTNQLSGTVDIAIKKDTSIRVGGRWSGFDDNPDGLVLPGIEWVDFKLDDNFTITPPQNLQVTFPSQPSGEIKATIDAWSKNPNIGGVPTQGGEQWNWRVELISSSGDVLSVKDFNENILAPTLYVDTSKVQPDEEYQIKVTVMNEYEASTSVISPQLYSLPPAPIIRRITYYKNGDTYTAVIDWAKPRSSGSYDEFIRLNVPGYVNDLQLAQIQNGASISSSIEVPNLPPATELVVSLSNTSFTGQQEVQETIYTPSEVPEITAVWDDAHKCITVSASAPNVTEFKMSAGYYQGGSELAAETGTSIKLCDLEHGTNQILYVSAEPRIPNHNYPESTGFATIQILNPILGISNTCDSKLNVVDIVESKNGEVTKRWQTGERVKTIASC